MSTNIRMEDLFRPVKQPSHSKGILLQYQEEYMINTTELQYLYTQGIPVPIPQRDLDRWLFHFKVFLVAEGDVDDLIVSKKNNYSDSEYFDDDPCFSNQTRGQLNLNKKEEEDLINLFFFTFMYHVLM